MTVSDDSKVEFAGSWQYVKWFEIWARTTAGVVVMLLALQFVTGVLLSFYYVPSTAHAHITVAYIEKVVASGSWIRALHYHGSQWLTVFLLLHLVQLFAREAYHTQRAAWFTTVILLALTLKAGGTGYSLPWDARAFFSTRVAEGLVGGLPLIGTAARRWMLGGNEISTLTLSRFYGLHVLVTPFLILLVIFTRFYRVGRQGSGGGHLLNRFTLSTIAAGIIFIGLALYSARYRAPLGPAATDLTPDYLPRPGPQFTWLYELLKHLPASLSALLTLLILIGFGLLPFLRFSVLERFSARPQRVAGFALLSILIGLVIMMTALSYISDLRDPRTREQLAKQAAAEAAFRSEPFVPAFMGQTETTPDPSTETEPPEAYKRLCATCHGEEGQGAQVGPLKFPSLMNVSLKPQRTASDIMAIIEDPEAYGLQPPMRSFAGKITEEEKRAIAEWVVKLVNSEW